MTLQRHYQEELQSLRELGKEFADAYPAVAGLVSHAGADPDVERLLQGFAFLTGRIRRKLDDDFPELVESLMRTICPHYVRPMPSFAMLEFKPRPGGLRAPQTLPAGIDVLSKRVEGVRCSFRTTSAFELTPLTLSRVGLEKAPGNPTHLKLTLTPGANLTLAECLPERIRLHCSGAFPRASELYRTLVSGVAAVRAVPVGKPSPRVELRDGPLEPQGFARRETLLPVTATSVPGHWLFQEYFTFPQKFLFAEFGDLEALRDPAFDAGAEILLVLSAKGEALERVTTDDLRLHCVPSVNLLSGDAAPIRVQPGRTRFRVRPEGAGRVVYSVDRISGVQSLTAEEVVYPDFLQAGGGAERPAGQGYYHVETEPADTSDWPEYYLRFLVPDGDEFTPRHQVLSVELTATHGRLPEALKAGDISARGPSCPEFVSAKNLERPTLAVSPPLGKGLFRRLLAHLTLGCQPLTSVESLRDLIGLYDYAALRSNEAKKQNTRRIEGIVGLRTSAADRIVEGGVVRGVDVHLDLKASHFASDGDMYLFSSILDRFLGLHVTVNQFTRLVVREEEREERWAWPLRSGRQSIL